MPDFDEDGLPTADGTDALPASDPGENYDSRHYDDPPDANYDSRQDAEDPENYSNEGRNYADPGADAANYSNEGRNFVASSTSSDIGSSIGFAVSGVATKVSEAASAMLGSLGSIGNFSKLGANLPSFASLSAAALKAGGTLLGNAQSKVTNNLLSKAASAATGSASASQIKDAAGVETLSEDHVITLTETGTSNVVPFKVMPQVTEAHSVEYEHVAPSQFIGAFMKFKGVAPVQWTISGTFVSRTPDEAEENYGYLNRLRGWKQPFWGDNTGRQFPGKLGGPPPVLRFKGLRGVIGEVPVVITSLNWAWPKDVDYIPMSKSVGEDKNPLPFPAVMNVDLQVIESYSTGEMNAFSLKDYRSGKMKAAFGGSSNLIIQANGGAVSGSGTATGSDENYSHEGRNVANTDDTNYSNEGRNAGVDTSNYSNEGRSSAQTVGGSTPDTPPALDPGPKQQEIDDLNNVIEELKSEIKESEHIESKLNQDFSASKTPEERREITDAINTELTRREELTRQLNRRYSQMSAIK